MKAVKEMALEAIRDYFAPITWSIKQIKKLLYKTSAKTR